MSFKLLDLLAQRRTTHDFRWATQSWSSCEYFVRGQPKTPQELVAAVLESKNVQETIQKNASEGGLNVEDVKKEAKSILQELAHDFHMYAIRWFAIVLSKLGKRLYNSIQVNTEKLELIKKAYGKYPVLILPTHRSYVDFLLVSYVSFSLELPLPIIAAGMDFKGMTGIGETLRKSGAFFIRRSFGNDELYWAIISEYIKIGMMEGGHPLEMFVEGTRSRSGKSLVPKVGLLSIVAELVTSGQVPDVLILPISMSYDRTLEEQLYAHELYGKPKPKESTNGLMRALKWLQNQSYGSVYVEFGDIISIRNELESAGALQISHLQPPEAFLNSIKLLAQKIVLRQQSELVIPLIAGISLIILSKISREIVILKLSDLISRMHALQWIIAQKVPSSRFGYPLSEESLEKNVLYILEVHASLVVVEHDGNGTKNGELYVNYHVGNPVEYMVFQHYANQILHAILPLSIQLIGSSVNRGDSEKGIYCFVRDLLQEEFPTPETTFQEFCWAKQVLTQYKNLDLKSTNAYAESFSTTDLVAYETLDLFNLLKSGLEPFLIAYWAVITKLLEVSKKTTNDNSEINVIEVKGFVKTVQEYLSNEFECGNIKPLVYGALSVETLRNAVGSLVKLSAVERMKLRENNGSFGIFVKEPNRLVSITSHLEKLMGVDSWIVFKNMEKHSSAIQSNFEGGLQYEPPKLLSKL